MQQSIHTHKHLCINVPNQIKSKCFIQIHIHCTKLQFSHIDACLHLVTTSSTNITYKKKSISVKSNTRLSTYQRCFYIRAAFSDDIMEQEQWQHVAHCTKSMTNNFTHFNYKFQRLKSFVSTAFFGRAIFFLPCLERM